MIDDGRYDVIVVDAEDEPDSDSLRLDVAIAGGPHRGEVLSLTARDLGRDPIDLLAVPGTLTVEDGVPTIVLED